MIGAERVPQRGTLIGRGWKVQNVSHVPTLGGHHSAAFIEAGRLQSPAGQGQGQRSQGLGGQR